LGKCEGCALMVFFVGVWCCKTERMTSGYSGDCCYCFESIGCGGNLACIGLACCIPDWLNHYLIGEIDRPMYTE